MKRFDNWLCLTGILAAIFYLLHDIIGAVNYPGYDWTSQAISDLTAADSPVYVTAHGFSVVYGIFSCLCSALVCILVKNERKSLRIGILERFSTYSAVIFTAVLGIYGFRLQN